MKRIQTLISLVVSILSVTLITTTSFCQSSRVKIDPYLKAIKRSYETQQKSFARTTKVERVIKLPNSFFQKFQIDNSNNDPVIRALVEFEGDSATLANAGANPYTKVGSIYTISFPLSRYDEIMSLNGLKEVELGKPMDLQMDEADQFINLSLAKAILPYRGSGVVVGIIDSGVDPYHPAFLGPDGKSRVSVIWDQSGPDDNNGLPYGWLYGRTQIRNSTSLFGYSDDIGHGTHVAGIAVGNGASSSGQTSYEGIATEAEIKVVKIPESVPITNPSEQFPFSRPFTTNIIDAINFISRGNSDRPWMVNLSVGTIFGPKNGTSLFERAISEIANDGSFGRGRVIVCAAGNFGVDLTDPVDRVKRIHSEGTNGTSRKFITERLNPDPSIEALVMISIHHNRNYYPSITLTTPSGITIGPIHKFNAGLEQTVDGDVVIFNDADGVDGYGGLQDHRIDIFLTDADFNEDGVLDHFLPDLGEWTIQLADGSGEWDAYAYGLSSVAPYFTTLDFSNKNLIAEPGNAESVITVGSINSRDSWVNRFGLQSEFIGTLGPIGGVSNFSSPGPTRAGLNKPDIFAPGAYVASAKSPDAFFANDFESPESSEYVMLAGTSFAAPFVTGTVALLLEKWIVERQEYGFNWQDVKAALRTNSSPNSILNVYETLDDDIIVGVNDYIEITSSYEEFPPGEIISYGARFISYDGTTYPTRWQWYIDLEHSTGTYRYVEKTVDSARMTDSWWFSSPAIPNGYSWSRTTNGHIKGKLTVETLDNQAYGNLAELDLEVWYRPNEPFIYNVSESSSSVTISYLSGGATSFKIYYDNDMIGSYDGNDATQGVSPVNAGNNTEFTLSGLDLANKQYRIAVTGENSHGASDLSGDIIVGNGPGSGEYNVTWIDFFRTSVSGTRVTNTNTSPGWKGSAASANRIPSNTNGHFEFIVPSPLYNRMIGFSENNFNSGTWTHHWETIEYNMYLQSNGNILIYHSGALQGSVGTYSAGDVIRIEREGSNIHFKVNGSIRHTSNCPYSKSLIIDFCLYTPADYYENVKISHPAGISFTSPNLFEGGGFNSTLMHVDNLIINSEPILSDSLSADLFGTLTVSPNPVKNDFLVSFESRVNSLTDIIIYSERNGEKVLHRKWQVNVGKNELRLDFGSLRTGTYTLELIIKGKKKQVRALKI